MRQVVNRPDAERQASVERSPSPQTPHLRITHAHTRGVTFPISNLGIAGFATQRLVTMLDWCDLAHCLSVVKQSVKKFVTGATLAALPPRLIKAVQHGDAA